jgi:hypothetical protein
MVSGSRSASPSPSSGFGRAGGRGLDVLEGQRAVPQAHLHRPALGELAEEQLLASGFFTCSWITRASGRAPYSGS